MGFYSFDGEPAKVVRSSHVASGLWWIILGLGQSWIRQVDIDEVALPRRSHKRPSQIMGSRQKPASHKVLLLERWFCFTKIPIRAFTFFSLRLASAMPWPDTSYLSFSMAILRFGAGTLPCLD